MAQAINLQITPSNVMPKIYASQFDIGREIEIILYDGASAYTPPVGTDIRFEGKKPDGNGFSYACTYTGNVVTIVTTDQMTVLAGEIPCELRMSLNGNDIGTLNIIFVIEKSPIDENVPISDTEIPAIVELARDEQYTAEAWATGERNGVPVGPTDPQYHNNAKYWAEHAEYGALDDLTDVEITTPSDGQALIYDANADEWVNGDVVDALDDLSDTNITTPTDGQALIYDADNDEWINGDVSTVENLSDLTDTDITTPTNEDGLVYVATAQKWENVPIMTKEQWKKNGAYNHCPNNATTQVVSGITFTVNSDGTITIGSGTPSAQAALTLASSIHFKTGRYKVCGTPSGGNYNTGYAFFVTKGSDTVATDATNTLGLTDEFTVTSESDSYSVYVIVRNGAVLSESKVIKPMITTDLNATYADYVPYAKTNRELTESQVKRSRITLTSSNITAGNGKTFYVPQNSLPSDFHKMLTIIPISVGPSGWGTAVPAIVTTVTPSEMSIYVRAYITGDYAPIVDILYT